jgi:hypothetical protein
MGEKSASGNATRLSGSGCRSVRNHANESVAYGNCRFEAAAPSAMLTASPAAPAKAFRCLTELFQFRGPNECPLWVYSVEKLADGAFSIISGGHQTINLATCVAYARFWRVGFLIHPLTRQQNRVFQQNRSQAGIGQRAGFGHQRTFR